MYLEAARDVPQEARQLLQPLLLQRPQAKVTPAVLVVQPLVAVSRRERQEVRVVPTCAAEHPQVRVEAPREQRTEQERLSYQPSLLAERQHREEPLRQPVVWHLVEQPYVAPPERLVDLPS